MKKATFATLASALSVAAGVAFASTSALAFHCPADMARIDKALSNGAKLSAADKAQVQSWRSEGERLHKAGKHADAVRVLAKALAKLKINN